ncbi:MAG: TonB-dependent receptor [Proteobacteria bacterium]|nr:TonB-dependent receptor [Pseudomonadota bacterium]MBU1714237.1 TonB-dependent receptor [Pseudomonadota bacterium]
MNARKCLIVVILLGFCSVPLVAWAGEMAGDETEAMASLLEMDLEQLTGLEVSLATGSLKPLRLAPAVASVITAEDIEKMGAATLDDVLQTVPGLYAAPSGFNIFSSIWSIRGVRTSNNPHVLLLINGVPLTQVIDGRRAQTYHMQVAMISRVEVVRGPGSAVHGADAFAGTVNVITKDGQEVDGTKAGLRYGSFETSDGWLQHGSTYGGWDIVGGLEGRKTAGDDERIVEQDRLGSGAPSLAPGPLDTRSQQVDAHLGFNKDNRWIARFYGVLLEDNAMGPGGTQTLNYDSFVDGRQLLADLSYHNNELVSDWDLSLQATYFYSYFDNDFQLFPAEYLNMRGNPIATTQTSSLEAVGLYHGVSSHLLRFAAGLKYSDVETDEYRNFPPGVTDPYGQMIHSQDSPYIYMKDQYRSLWHVSLQDEWSLIKGWELTAGLRYDDYSDFGATTNPRVALVWEARYDLTTKLMYGRAFRPPAFNEMYINYNPSVVGNSAITPETIDTYELAFDYQPARNLRTVVSVFYFEIDGLIELGGTPVAYDNRRDQKGHGFELEVQWQAFAELKLSGNLSNQRSEDMDTGEQTPDTPEWQAYLTGNWLFMPQWSLDGQVYLISTRHRAADDPREDIDDYEMVNLTIRRKNIFKHWDMALAVRNVFDQDIREPSPYDPAAPDGAYIPNDYPMEGRAVWAELRASF